MTAGDSSDLPLLSRTESGPAASANEEPAPDIEGYEITGRLGRGGMGVVWSALQLSTRRAVAIKILPNSALASPRARARFEREVELAASLEHPNITRVYDSGILEGMHYYAMELVHGLPLDRYCDERALSVRQRLEIMRAVCLAVQYAHQHGVIHRDLKPANILVDADGKPCVMDFGLAKSLLAEGMPEGATEDGEAPGTPAYMSPEQVAGKSERVDTRSDVYSLGVILYGLLTGKHPHGLTGSRYEVLRRIAEEEIVRPRLAAQAIDRDLDALLLKALARDPEERYAAAGELAADLGRYLSGEPLAARRPTLGYFLAKRLKRHRAVALTVAGIAAAAAVVVAFAFREVTKAERGAQEAVDYMRDHVLDPAQGNMLESLREAADGAGSAFKDKPAVEAEIRNRVGLIYMGLRRSDLALEQFTLAVDLRRRVLGEGHAETLSSLANLANALRAEGRLDESEAMHRRVLDSRKRLLGESHPDTLASMTNLANVRREQGAHDEAEHLTRDALASMRRVLGERHADTLATMNNLAAVLGAQGRYEESEALLRELLGLMMQAPDWQKNREALGVMNNLGQVLGVMGRNAEAQEWCARALDLRRRALHEDHPDTLASMRSLAQALAAEGKLAEAEALLKSGLPIMRRTLGDAHALTRGTAASLASVLEAQGRTGEAGEVRASVGLAPESAH